MVVVFFAILASEEKKTLLMWDSLYGWFVVSVFVVSLVFLYQHVEPHQATLVNFNQTMYQFVWASLWIIVACVALEVFIYGWRSLFSPGSREEVLVVDEVERQRPYRRGGSV